MEYKLSETQQLLQTTARSYLQDTFPWERLYAFEDGSSKLTGDDVSAFAELGWMALLAPEAAGGGGATLLEGAIVIEELGYAAVPAPITASNVAAHVLNTASASDYLADLTSNRKLFTISEASRRKRPAASGLSAAGGKLSGTLPMVPFAAPVHSDRHGVATHRHRGSSVAPGEVPSLCEPRFDTPHCSCHTPPLVGLLPGQL